MQPVYYIECAARKCIVEIIVNGLKVIRKNAGPGMNINYPFNTELIGKENLIIIRGYPTLDEKGHVTTFEDLWINGAIKQYAADDVIGPENGIVIHPIDFNFVKQKRQVESGNISNLVALFPISEAYSLDNEEGASFRNRLIESQIIKDQKAVFEYAKHLRDLIRQRNIPGLFEEYKEKLVDYDLAFPQDAESDNSEWFANLMKDRYFPSGPVDDFKDEEILPVSWCEGRIWEIMLNPDRPFFITQGKNGKKLKIEVYVGMVNGKIRIIR